jgi:DNA polymerase IIIc chi subunit
MWRWKVICACALVGLGSHPALAQDAEEPDSTPIEVVVPAQSAAEARIDKVLDEKTKFDFSAVPLDTAVAFIQDSHGIKVEIDRDALDTAKIDPKETVNLKVQDITLRSALRLMLRAKGLEFLVRNGALVVTSSEKAGSTLVLKVYLVADLLMPRHDQPEWPDFQPLCDTIGSYVDPGSWEFVGGPANMMELGKARSLVIAQTENGHEQIALLLAALRAARDNQQQENPNREPIELLSPGAAEARARIQKALDEQVDFDFHQRPLTEVIDFIKAHHKIEILLDTKSLEDDTVDPNQPITRRLKGISLRSALRLMLGAIDLQAVLNGEVLLVTTSGPDERFLTKLYPVGDLVLVRRDERGSADFQAIIELITETIGPVSWEETGGEGSISEFRPSLALIVSQRAEAHDEIAKLLAGERQARAAQKSAAGAAE